MAFPGVGPTKQAFVRALRDISALNSGVSNEFHEGFALENTDYPYVVYNLIVSSRSHTWGDTGEQQTTIDVFVLSDDQVEAHNLDQLMATGLENKDLSPFFDSPYEQSTLFCRRVLDLSFVDEDGAGNKVYQVGGSYLLWTAS